MAIKSFALFKNTQIGTQGVAGTGLSDVIDVRELSPWQASLLYTIAGTNGAATAGSSTFMYLGCSTRNGNFVLCGTFGTQGASPHSGVKPLAPVPNTQLMVTPFMKIQAVSGTSNALLLTAELCLGT